MSRIYLVGGGCRSGKSKFAMQLAESLPGPKIFLATAQSYDEEMTARIRRHQLERDSHWQTWEEPVAVAEKISQAGESSVFLIDCLTLWVSQLMLADWSHEQILAAGDQLLTAITAGKHDAVIVSNEVGMGLVPEYPMGREFRDLMGWLHQAIAKQADEVFFTAFGISLPMKKLQQLALGDRPSHD